MKKENNDLAVLAAAIPPFPIGTILALATNTLPQGWLPCDGSLIPSTCLALITALGGVVGKCCTPNLVGRTLVGAGTLPSTTQTDNVAPNFDSNFLTNIGTIGNTGGEGMHQLLTAELASHSHSINKGDFGAHYRSFKGDSGSDQPFETTHSGGGTDASGGDKAHNNTQPYYTVKYIIYAGS